MKVGRAGAWRWVVLPVVLAIHDRQIAEHGGLPGMRDPGAVESTLARPQNLAAYGGPDAAALAAACAYGVARNHGFSDGNKRTAWVVARLFLADNGHRLHYDPAVAVRTVAANSHGSEQGAMSWSRGRSR